RRARHRRDVQLVRLWRAKRLADPDSRTGLATWSPVLIVSEPDSYLLLTRFLYANRYPLLSKTLWFPADEPPAPAHQGARSRRRQADDGSSHRRADDRPVAHHT